MEPIIKILIYVHAFFGGLGLIAGTLALTVTKGSALHVKSGKAFSLGMLVSALLSLIIASMPGHLSAFLFLIGIFTIYMVIAGNRTLTFRLRSKEKADRVDRVLSGTMMFLSVVMVALGIYFLIAGEASGYLFLFFGGFGILMTRNDFRFFKNFRESKNEWLLQHIGRMVGAMIASVTAFIIAGLDAGSLIAWIAPSLVGVGYIIFWRKKIEAGKSVGKI